MKKIVTLLFLFAAVVQPCNSFAEQADVDAVTRVVESQKSNDVDFSEINIRLKNIEDSIKSGQASDDDVKSFSNTLTSTESSLLDIKKQQEREAKFVQKRIEALGDGPKDGDTELEIITQKRQEFAQEMALQKAKIAEVDILLAKIYELNTLAVNQHNRQLLGDLMSRQPSLVYPQNLYTSTKSFLTFLINIIESPAKWYKNSTGMLKANMLISISLMMALLLLGIWVRLVIMKKWGYRSDITSPNYEQKLLVAVRVAVAYGIIPSCIIGGFLVWIISTGGLSQGFFSVVLANALYFSLYAVIGRAIARVTFAPYHEDWRLVKTNTFRAKNIVNSIYWSLILVCASLCLDSIATHANYPIELLYFLSTLSAGIQAFCFALIVNSAIKKEQTEDDDAEDDKLSGEWKISFFTTLFSLGIFGLALAGYSRLALYIMSRLFLSALMIGAFVLIKRALTDFFNRLLTASLSLSKRRVKNKIIENLDLFTSIIFTPILLLLLIFALLNLWGMPTDFLLQSIKKLFLGFKIGGVEISLVSILLGIAAFFGAIYLFKIMTAKLKNNILTKLSIDDGIKNSMLTTLRFLSTIFAALVAIVVMGVDLTNLALIAGALSIGIGFGLQNIINNLVSGLIILFERPFQVGDWVIINGEEGKIKQVNIRSTEVETFKRSSVIIPNANLLSSSVTNLTHGNNVARCAVQVGVAYGSDVEKVRKILLECANNHRFVLKNPAPYVLFQDFGSSSLNFELRCYTANIWDGWIIPSDLRFEINRRFIEEKIEIPFPQIVVHSGEKVSDDKQFYAKKDI